MANNYSLGANKVELNTGELEVFNKIMECMEEIEEFVDDVEVVKSKYGTDLFNAVSEIYKSNEVEDFGIGFNYEVTEGSLYVSDTGETYNMELVSDVIELVLERSQSNKGVGLEMAFTCSKPRSGEFGGAAVFVTREGQQWTGTSVFIREKQKEWMEKLTQ